MGYMGFGMRKENYTRRPKKAFKRIKEAYGEELNMPKYDHTESNESTNEDIKDSFCATEKKPPFLIIKGILAIAISFGIIWIFILQDYFLQYKQVKFAQNSISQYYQTDLKKTSEVFEFLKTRTDKVVSISYMKREEAYDLRIKHKNVKDNYKDQQVKFISYTGDNFRQDGENNDEIVLEVLHIIRDGFVPKSYQFNWIYELNLVSKAQIPISLASSLDSDEKSFNTFLHNIKQLNYSIRMSTDNISSSFSHEDFGTYDIFYSKENPEFIKQKNEEQQRIVGVLRKDIYWSRRKHLD